MKKYKRLILSSIAIYLLLAVAGGFMLGRMQTTTGRIYKVEINRIMAQVEENAEAELPELDNYQYVKAVTFLSATEESQLAIQEFYEGSEDLKSEIQPIYQGNKLMGYLRMDYLEEQEGMRPVITLEILLLILEIFVLMVLFYLKKNLVRPFNQMMELSAELSNGNLKGEVKREKESYLGDFQLSLSQLKDNLEVSRKRELELLRERKLLLLSLSHDIKTPLSTIKLYNRALMEGVYDLPEKQQEAYVQIEEKIKNIEKYINEIVKSSREDILDIPVEQGEFYLKDLMEKVLGVYGEQCQLRKIKLSVGNYNNRIFSGDIHRLTEVFENIFENAFKYGDGRCIEISFEEAEYCQLIRVFNTGEVVAENDFTHLFDSFYRGNNTHGRNGNGLGLYICREIMRKVGGEIYAETEADGMAFVVVLPM